MWKKNNNRNVTFNVFNKVEWKTDKQQVKGEIMLLFQKLRPYIHGHILPWQRHAAEHKRKGLNEERWFQRWVQQCDHERRREADQRKENMSHFSIDQYRLCCSIQPNYSCVELHYLVYICTSCLHHTRWTTHEPMTISRTSWGCLSDISGRRGGGCLSMCIYTVYVYIYI